MAYHSLHFAVFFPAVVCVYFALPYRFRWQFLLAASLYFYAAWRAPYVLLLIGAIAVSYLAGLGIAQAGSPGGKKLWLGGGLGLLLGDLFLFKYFNFFNESFGALFGWLRLPYLVPAVDLVLPIGISFFTFQLASYVIDVYQGRLAAERHPGLFAVYLAFFPQLVAGPIERAVDLLPQFRRNHDFEYQRVADGLKLMAWGFFKKLVVADRIALFVDEIYGRPQDYSGVATSLATFLFAFQIYCDFSGYSDIAIGAAQTLGYRLTQNFERPYFAGSIQEFWKRWHISLTTWLTDYVYTPLTRSRWIRLPWYWKFLVCLLLTFLVSGLWHGARWTFVVWGGLHGAYLVASMLTRGLRLRAAARLRMERVPRLHGALRVGFTFALVCFSYIFFRAASMGDALQIVTHLHTGWRTYGRAIMGGKHLLSGLPLNEDLVLGLCGVLAVTGVDALRGRGSLRARIAGRPAWIRWSLYYAASLVILLFGVHSTGENAFIYFQF